MPDEKPFLNLTTEKLQSSIEVPWVKLFAWFLPKLGWMFIIWGVWTVKTYSDNYFANTPTAVYTKQALTDLANLTAKQNSQLERLSERQDISEKAFSEVLKAQQALSVSLAVQASKISQNEKSIDRIENKIR